MSIAKPKKKTPREWSREWLSRADDAGAEASASEVVEVVVTEAVAYERERCAKIAEDERVDAEDTQQAADIAYNDACKDIAKRIREA